jgi:hypothetical protein
MKKKTFNIISTNCDCCSDTIARYPTNYLYGPRCPWCNKILGCMQWRVEDKVRATGQREALQIYGERVKKRINERRRDKIS